jgi:hypothetical protein
MSPACGCQQNIRLERLLSEAAADSWPHSGLAEILSIADVTPRSCDMVCFAHDVVPQGSGDVDAVNEQDCRTGPGVGVGDINTVDADLLSRHWCTLNRFGPQVHMFHVTLTRRA